MLRVRVVTFHILNAARFLTSLAIDATFRRRRITELVSTSHARHVPRRKIEPSASSSTDVCVSVSQGLVSIREGRRGTMESDRDLSRSDVQTEVIRARSPIRGDLLQARLRPVRRDCWWEGVFPSAISGVVRAVEMWSNPVSSAKIPWKFRRHEQPRPGAEVTVGLPSLASLAVPS